MTVHHERRVKREKTQQDATNLIFIMKLLSQHVSGIIMPIIRRTSVCTAACITTPTPNTRDLTDTRTRYQMNTTAYTYTHEIPTMFTAHYSTQRHYGFHILRFCSPLVTVQNTICGSAHFSSPDDGHNDARNMLR